ncbi:hypothetical protein V6Z11_A12G046100 [Gossypium hirsutum]
MTASLSRYGVCWHRTEVRAWRTRAVRWCCWRCCLAQYGLAASEGCGARRPLP